MNKNKQQKRVCKERKLWGKFSSKAYPAQLGNKNIVHLILIKAVKEYEKIKNMGQNPYAQSLAKGVSSSLADIKGIFGSVIKHDNDLTASYKSLVTDLQNFISTQVAA